jgi:endonuclease-8
VPEGDTIFRTARTLHRALAGRTVVRFESVYPALTRVDDDRPIAGRVVQSVISRGKHLLMTFSDDLVLHTHMRMSGSWHIYRPGDRWQRPARDMRVLIATDPYLAVGFNVPVAAFLTAKALERQPALRALGPDLADPSFDRDEVIRRFREHDDEPIHQALLNQRVLAGIGNVLKSEVLFVGGTDPFAPVRAFTDEHLHRLLDVGARLMSMNTGQATANNSTRARHRRTTGRLHPEAALWVYGRAGKPCRTCGTAIASRATGDDARLTYWCPLCQRRREP